MKYNIWNKLDPLEVCMLGNNYLPEFFNGVTDKVGDPLKRICEETLEDLQGYKETLEKFGVKVIQPEMDPNERFMDNPHRYPRGPLQVRDNQLVLGNQCFSIKGDHPAILETLKKYSPLSALNFKFPYIQDENKYNIIAGDSFPSWEQFCENRTNKNYFEDFVWEELMEFSNFPCFTSAMCFMIGTKLFFANDRNHIPLHNDELEYHGNFDVIQVDVAGHSDGNYHPILPGAILSVAGVEIYNKNFPGWDICYLADESWHKVGKWGSLKRQNAGKWYLAGEEDNDGFTNFVETWLQDWVGFVEETVFDVNVLMLDEHHCCVSNPNNEKVNAFLKKHKVEPVHVPWRHRYFWDGGLHCITLDLKRRGDQKEYF